MSLLLAVVIVSACSSGSSGSSGSLSVSLKEVADATRAAGPARTSGTTGGSSGGNAAASGPVSGTVSGDLTGTGDVTATLLLLNANRAPVEIRWRDGFLYVKRAPITDPGVRAGLGGWATRAPSEKPWRKRAVAAQYTPDAFSPFAPAALAALLATRGAKVETTHDGSRRKVHTTAPIPILGPWTNATVDLRIDGQNRVVRVDISSRAGGIGYDVSYGGAAPDPAVPAANQIETGGVAPPAPSGPYVAARSGTDDNVTWSVQRAPSTKGYECWRWQANPTVKIVATDADGNRCIVPAGTDDDISDRVQFVASTNGTGAYDVLVARIPADARSATVTPIGGQPQPVAVSDGVFVFVGPTSPKIGFVEVTLGNGAKVACGPGWVEAPTDWSSIDGAERKRVLSSPWGCG